MEVTTIITGSWFPRTKLHLKEYYAFLKTAKSHLPIPQATLDKAHEMLLPENVSYVGGLFDETVADLRGYRVRYTEDGLLLISKKVTNIVGDVAGIRMFHEDRVAKALSAIYTLGTPVVMHKIPHTGMRPVLLFVKDAADRDVRSLFSELKDDAHFVAHGDRATTYFGDDHIVIVDGGMNEAERDALTTMYVFFREYEHKLRHYLDLHRTIWESLADFRGRKTLTTKDLPGIRDRLLDYRRDLAVTRGRLGQMESYLAARRAVVDESGRKEWLVSLEAYRFDKVAGATAYMNELWEMLDDYIGSTAVITGLLYQENLQREINFQQFIFLVGAVAGTLMLGTITGATISLDDADGSRLATGILTNFSVRDLVVFGGAALLISLFIFAIIRPIVSSLRRIQVKTLFQGSDKGDEEERLNL